MTDLKIDEDEMKAYADRADEIIKFLTAVKTDVLNKDASMF